MRAIYWTNEPDADHTYGLVFHLPGRDFNMSRWFASVEDAKRFASSNAIVPVDFIRHSI